MKKKMMAAMVMAAALSITTAGNAMAGTWSQDSKGWWWQLEDGTRLIDRSASLDGNLDGIAENYYFDKDGYLLTSTTTYDGGKVNAEGMYLYDDGTVLQTSVATTYVNTQSNTIEGYYLGDKGYSDWDKNGVVDSEYIIYYGFAIKVLDDNTISVLSDQYDNMQPTSYHKVADGVYETSCQSGIDRITFTGSNLVSSCSAYGDTDTFKK